MSKDKLYIPTKCKVGFNTRKDTYTGKLGYIIYHDGKVWRKEQSWEGWREKYIPIEEYEAAKLNMYNSRIANYTEQYEKYKKAPLDTNSWEYRYYQETINKSLEEYVLQKVGTHEDFYYKHGNTSTDKSINPIEFENVPTEGFVLNKKVGGYKSDWNFRQAYCRVYDPRGWEFEITVPNLLFILECCNSIKGKGLEGEFIYSWEGKDLVLLPCSGENYQSSIEHTKLQSKSISTKDLTPGCSYLNNQGDNLIYLGKLDYPDYRYVDSGQKDRWGYIQKVRQNYTSKKFVFYTNNPRYTWDDKHNYLTLTGIVTIKEKISEVIVENYAELLENYYKLYKTDNNGKTE